MIVPVDPKFQDYAQTVKDALFGAGLDIEIDDGKHTFAKKIAEAQVAGYNYILVVGEKEKENVRPSPLSLFLLLSLISPRAPSTSAPATTSCTARRRSPRPSRCSPTSCASTSELFARIKRKN